MGIRLIDCKEEAAYDEAQQKYAAEIERRNAPDFKGDRYSNYPEPPRAPKPFADSNNKGVVQPFSIGLLDSSYRYGSTRDPESGDKEVTDGTANTTPKGFAVVNPNPFKLGR